MANAQSEVLPTKIKGNFWPIHAYELGKFLPMCLLMFCILFNQNILRILKDSILISEISAEAVSFAKVYCVTPVAALFVIFYAKMVNHFNFKEIFYILTAIFVGFFAFFAFILYPNTHIFHKDALELQQLMSDYPNFKWYIALAGNWGYIVFYTLAELWPNVFYVLLFWQCANEITTSEEAKRFYTLFSLFGNSSLIVVGLLMMNLSSEATIAKHFINISENKLTLVQISTALVCLFAIFSCLMIKFVRNNFHDPAPAQHKAPKKKMGLVQSFHYIVQSRYLWLMLICSAAFGLAMNLVEAVWKAKIKELYPTVNSYAEFNSLYILWTGVAIMAMTILGNHLMRKYSWFLSAVLTPLIILVTGAAFFLLVVFDHQLITSYDSIIFFSPLALAVFIGAIQNVLAKGSKYSIWDTSREMLYIPLDNELKTKGKAAVDVVSSKVGKSASGLIQSAIFTLIPTATFTSISPILMVVFIIVCVMWVYAVKEIYGEYQKFGLS
jgi:ATP:ADP antiporter, AAA family